MKVIAPNPVDRAHLKIVVERMKRLGPPKIKVIWCHTANAWVAVEGSHRLRAAKKLGIVPDFVDVSHKEKIILRRDHYNCLTRAAPAAFLRAFLAEQEHGALHSFKTEPRRAR